MKNKYYQKELNFTINIELEILNQVKKYSEDNFPNEIGGILIGKYSKDGLSVDITEIIVPKEYVSKKFLFIRYGNSLNKKIKKLYKASKGEIIYVGEWHSHTNGSSMYSQKDFNSMMEISEDNKVKIDSPLLLISAITKDAFEPNFYIFHNKKLYKYETEN